ncbi:MAG: hypothetical protein HQK51_15435 [Oligoflexia bacterium]|nr:hypothetical protein [Oligoflexia bacterium]
MHNKKTHFFIILIIFCILFILEVATSTASNATVTTTYYSSKTNNNIKKNDTNIVKCLAKEENIIHKNKVNGPIYALNKELLNELVIDETISIKEIYLKKICAFKEFSPSVLLLQHLLIDGKNIFNEVKYKPDDFSAKSRATYLIDNLLDMAPNLFVNYLMELQNMTPTMNCLETRIPELGSYLRNYQHLEDEDISGPKILFDVNKIKTIFEKLKNFDKIFKECTLIRKKELNKVIDQGLIQGQDQSQAQEQQHDQKQGQTPKLESKNTNSNNQKNKSPRKK